MKFNEIQQTEWDELKPYLDTCLLPMTGLSGAESPWKVTKALEELRDLMDLVEIPFKGRVVTYPAIQYRLDDDQMIAAMDMLCEKLRADSFKYVILITADHSLAKLEFKAHDLILSPLILTEKVSESRDKVISEVQKLWNKQVQL
jgi:23S rRNA (pseudouridine1915-N3)-methyltransferase